MYPKKTKEYKSSHLEIFVNFKDFLKQSIESLKSIKTFIMYLHKNFHF